MYLVYNSYTTDFLIRLGYMASSNAFSKQEESVKKFPLTQEKIVIKKLQSF